ncbi:MAG: hypothetical protein PVI79_04050 [Gammaproteobacteria bacterium]|jgi:hypothetical protein
MNYYEAKLELMKRAPRMPFKLIALEAAALVIVAGVLVRFFA